MSHRRTYYGLWNRRIYDLMGALGISLIQLARLFGYSCLSPVTRILAAGKPSVQFLLALQTLERKHEEQIKDFIYQGRPYKKFARRRRERERLEALTVYIRPEDIREMGAGQAVGKDGGIGSDEGSGSPLKIVVWSPPLRGFAKKNHKVTAG